LLNDPSFVKAARGFALRLKPGTDEQRIREAIKLALARDPKSGGLDSLTKFLKIQRETYQSKPDDAVAFLKTGLADPSTDRIPPGLRRGHSSAG
jgi:hypothetical protein